MMTQKVDEGAGARFELPSVQPTREGYGVYGLEHQSRRNGRGVHGRQLEVRQSLTVYARWARKQTEIAVTFDKNGGDTEADPRVMTQKVDEGASARSGLTERPGRRARGTNLRAGTPKQTERARRSRRKPK